MVTQQCQCDQLILSLNLHKLRFPRLELSCTYQFTVKGKLKW